MLWSEKIDQIAPALLKAQSKMQAAKKSSTNPHFKSKYADLSEVYGACSDALHENGITILQGARNDGELIGVETILLHTSGQFMRETLMLRPSKPDPQGAGSAITYARRYSLAAMIGVMQEDDDANLASSKDNSSIFGSTGLPKHPTSTQRPLTGPEAVARAHELIAQGKPKPVSPQNYVVPFGKYSKGKKLMDMSDKEIQSLIDYVRKQANISKDGQDLIDNAEAYLGLNKQSDIQSNELTYQKALDNQDIPIPF